ncbi:MAG: single-stranded-DNA-specific exonuclease RecJ [Desulfitobacteriaceae bacterium]|nr:single-stranded-DNA-specific exonuclease RecJ [Desulfitobacteriaceae bacterium]
MELSRELNISPIVARILMNRGLTSVSAIKLFLTFTADDLHSPFKFHEMAKAVALVEQNIKSQKKILIYGDYDVDGITATTLLYQFLKSQKADVQYYIPDRMKEGYGLNKEAIEWADHEGFGLIITVDCGISSLEEIKLAKSLGINIIITDHHQPPALLPVADAIINPRVVDSGYPFSDLAGVGVAWKLAQAIYLKLGDQQKEKVILSEFLDLVSLGTIADVVALTGENRTIVKMGLEAISKTKRLGLKALINVAGIKGKEVSATQVGFLLAPRLNAAGRLSNARIGVELLQSSDHEYCLEQAKVLNQENNQRQSLEKAIFDEALEMIEGNSELQEELVLVLASERWHQGVIGVVASRLVERFYRPVILMTIEGEVAKGSARSIESFHMYHSLEHCKDLLIQFGGHKQAAGLKLPVQNIEAFRRKINKWAQSVLKEEDLIPIIQIDADKEIDGSEEVLAGEIAMLSPFGQDNPCPVFSFRNSKVKEVRAVGANAAHLKIKFESEGKTLEGIGFNMGGHLAWLNDSDRVDAAGILEMNNWNGCETVQLVLKDIQPAPVFSFIDGKQQLADPHKEDILKGFQETAYVKSLSNEVSGEQIPKIALAFPRSKQRAFWHGLAAYQYFNFRRRTLFLTLSLSELWFEGVSAERELNMLGITVLKGDSRLSPKKKAQLLNNFVSGAFPVLLTTPDFLESLENPAELIEDSFIIVDYSNPIFLLEKTKKFTSKFTELLSQSQNFRLLVLAGFFQGKFFKDLQKNFFLEKTYSEIYPGRLEIIDYRELEDKSSYLFNVIKNGESCLVYVMFKHQVDELVKDLSNKGFTMVAGCTARQRPWEQEILAEKVAAGEIKVLITHQPIISSYTRLFKHVVLFNVPHSLAEFCDLTGWPGEGELPKAHLIYSTADLAVRERLLEINFPGRETLGKIYRAFCTLSLREGKTYGSKIEILNKLKSVGFCSFKDATLDAALAIFLELGIIKQSACENIFLEPVQHGEKVALDNSPRFREGEREKEMFSYWRRPAVSPDFTSFIKNFSEQPEKKED